MLKEDDEEDVDEQDENGSVTKGSTGANQQPNQRKHQSDKGKCNTRTQNDVLKSMYVDG